jgi:serine/threonine-protein kinase RsbW
MEQYRLSQPSDRSIIPRIESFLRSVPAIEELSPERRFNLIVATMEAVTNAIVHGNKSDREKNVEIWIDTTEDSIRVHVRDWGDGFDPELLPDPRHKENLLREGGRGVFLIRSLVDEVEFVRHQPGIEVVMTMYRSP